MEDLGILLSIITLNIVLSGDNAVVIAMAGRNLPEDQQRKAILIGSGGAYVFRIILTVAAFYLLKIPFVQAAGGLLLIYIAIKLLTQKEGCEEYQAACSLKDAIKIIIFADIIMSLDNTLAIVAVAKGSWLMLLIGLATSIPIIIFCSKIIMYFMNKYPIIIYIGAGILAWTSGEMVIQDEKVMTFLSGFLPHMVHRVFPLVVTVAVLLYGWRHNIKSSEGTLNTHSQ